MTVAWQLAQPGLGHGDVLNPYPSALAVVATLCRCLEGVGGSIFSAQHLCSSPARFPFAEGCVGLHLKPGSFPGNP